MIKETLILRYGKYIRAYLVERDVFGGLCRGYVIPPTCVFIYINKGGKNPSPSRNTSHNREE